MPELKWEDYNSMPVKQPKPEEIYLTITDEWFNKPMILKEFTTGDTIPANAHIVSTASTSVLCVVPIGNMVEEEKTTENLEQFPCRGKADFTYEQVVNLKCRMNTCVHNDLHGHCMYDIPRLVMVLNSNKELAGRCETYNESIDD